MLFTDILKILSDGIWGLPTVGLILSVGAAYSFKLRLPQLRRLGELPFCLKNSGGGGLTPFQSLSTSLAATVGTGSVTGVATALTLGGPGAVFWLWVSAFLGMAVAYAEGVLSVRYRGRSPDGSPAGGIWFSLRDGLGMDRTARIYALFCVLASLGMGCMAQTNSAASALKSQFGLSPAVCGAAAAVAVLLCLLGKDFAAKLCERAVPLLAGIYVFGAGAVIVLNAAALPGVFSEIFRSAFGLRQTAGGAAGFGAAAAISTGFRRGVFSNEAGLGTTAAVHGASSVESPDRQGLMNMLEVVIDTFVICTLTALAILCSGAYSPDCPDGAELVAQAASGVFGKAAGCFSALCTAGFALATAVGWSQIGQSAADFLSPKLRLPYCAAYSLAAFFGAVMSLEAVWQLSDIFNGLMVIPCMAALILLFKEVCSESA